MTFLAADLRLCRGDFALEVAFELGGRGATSVFGRSGAGKTTLLRCIAGLERDCRGLLVVDGVTWQHSDRGVFVPPHARPIGCVLQEPGLFEHLDVAGNLRFGQRRVPASERRLGFEPVIDWLGLAPLLRRRPASLSGGERQRVAIGRALLTSPRLLLMDEPLAALDERSRREILPYLERLPECAALPIVYVSHSLPEVARLCEQMLWLEGGRVRAHGPAADLLASVDIALADAEAIGAVLVARVAQHDERYELTELDAPGGRLFVRRLDRPIGDLVRVQIPAQGISLALDREQRSSMLNVLAARVLSLHDVGAGQVAVRLQVGDGARAAVLLARITARSRDALALREGLDVFARTKSVGLLG